MKKLIFSSILCILGSTWGPEYRVSHAITGEELINVHSQEPLTFQGLCAAVQPVQPNCVFKGIPIMPPNAQLLIDSTILDEDNATQLLTGNTDNDPIMITLVRAPDRICLPMVGCEESSKNLICTLNLDFEGNIDRATAVRERATSAFDDGLQNKRPNTVHNTFLKDAHYTFLKLIKPCLQSIILCFKGVDINITTIPNSNFTGDDITVIQNPNLEVTIGFARHELTLIPNPNLLHKYLPHRELENIYQRCSRHNKFDLSLVTQDILDCRPTPDNPNADSTWSPADTKWSPAGAWIIQK